MKTPFVLALAFVAAACSSPGELRSKAPAYQGTSTKPAKAVAGCIADRWEAGSHRQGVNVRPTANGYAVTAEVDLGLYGKDTSFVVDVADTPGGSSSRFVSNIALSSGTALVAGIVRDCQR